MSNWFASIGQAASGINVAQYGLNVVSQNISNADTDGYNRQQVNQASVGAVVTSGMYTTSNPGALGGVRIASVSRVTDPVLDGWARTEHSRGAAADASASTLSNIEQIFAEPTTDGVASQLDTFWNSWAALANNPGDSGTRTTVLQTAGAVANTLNSLTSSLSSVSTDTSAALAADVSQANTAASSLASVNGQIAIATATGQNANDLLDQRDKLLDTLGKLVGGVGTINANGTASVQVAGQALLSGVNGATVGTLAVDASNNVTLNGSVVTLTGGSASSEVSTLTTVLPQYQSQLDGVAQALISAGNAIQTGGYDLSGATGTPLFSGTGAADIAVSLTDPNKLAASKTPGGNLDGSNALAASQRGSQTNGPDSLYRTLVANVGSASAKAIQVQNTQDAVVTNVNNLKASTSGVSYDEEVSQMLTYQHAFQASSKVLTILDSMLDTLINHTGVG